MHVHNLFHSHQRRPVSAEGNYHDPPGRCNFLSNTWFAPRPSPAGRGAVQQQGRCEVICSEEERPAAPTVDDSDLGLYPIITSDSTGISSAFRLR